MTHVTAEVKETVAPSETGESTPETSEQSSERRFFRGKERNNRDHRDRDHKKEKPKKEFDELLLEVRRVTRVTTGGRRMSFRATILVGNKKGKIGLGVSKGNDVAGAVSKATNEAYKSMFLVPITKGDTVPYALTYKYKSSKVRLLPASEGTGLKAGSSIRSVLELAGYSNILSKMIGSNNKLNNALATIQALASYKHADHFSSLREVKEQETPIAPVSTEKGEKAEFRKPAKTGTKPAAKPETTPTAKPEVRPEVKQEPKQETTPEVKQEVVQEVKPETKPEVMPEIKQEIKPEVKKEAKSEAKAETKKEVKNPAPAKKADATKETTKKPTKKAPVKKATKKLE